MGNEQSKQQTNAVVDRKKPLLSVILYVTNGKKCQEKLEATLKGIKAESHFLTDLRLENSTSEESSRRKHYQHRVVPFNITAEFQNNHVGLPSEIQFLSRMSNKFCRQLSDSKQEIFCWLKLKNRPLRSNEDTTSVCTLGVDSIAFGTLTNASTFVHCYRSSTGAGSVTTYQIAFQFEDRKISLTQEADQQTFCAEIEYRHLHRESRPIIHVVSRSEGWVDVYIQLQHPPLMYECFNVYESEQSRKSRRSFLYGVKAEDIGRSDILRVRFNMSDGVTFMQELLSKLQTVDNPHWELRFTWIDEERMREVTHADETKLRDNFAVLYASKVLQSIGLRCQLISCLFLVKDLPKEDHADFLYHVADCYEDEAEYYLIDINKIKQQWKSNSKQYTGMVNLVFLTPTRIIFKRLNTCESNRVLRDYFKDGREEYLMKVYFRDENAQKSQNLHFIHQGALDDHQVDMHIKITHVKLPRSCKTFSFSLPLI